MPTYIFSVEPVDLSFLFCDNSQQKYGLLVFSNFADLVQRIFSHPRLDCHNLQYVCTFFVFHAASSVCHSLELSLCPACLPFLTMTLAKFCSQACVYFKVVFQQREAWHPNGYGWIADQRHAHTKSICQRTVRATTLSRPSLESSWQGESRSIRTIFVWSFLTSYYLKQEKQDLNKNSPGIIGFASSNTLVPRSQTLLRCLGSLPN